MIRLEIVNDGTGNDERANYDVYLYLPKNGVFYEHHARVEDYDRSDGWQALVEGAVTSLGRVDLDFGRIAGYSRGPH